MSKIAADEAHGGSMLRKAIDYFCHLAVKPDFWSELPNLDPEYMSSEYAAKAEWLNGDKEDVYVPDYNDMLRVAFMYKFRRGKLADLVALLSGRNFETREYRSEIADHSFALLHDGVTSFMNRDSFKHFTGALKSAGLRSPKLIYSKGAVNFAYNLYLTLKDDKTIDPTAVRCWVKRWYVMSILTGRYSGSSETAMDYDIRNISERGFITFYNEIVASQMSDTFWNVGLPQQLTTTSIRTGAWLIYVASQVRAADNTLFTTDIKVGDIVGNIGNIHHIFPRAYLKKKLGAPQKLRNQIANYAYLEDKINIAIRDRRPGDYFSAAREACMRGTDYFGDIQDSARLAANLKANCIPDDIFDMGAEDYERFLAERRMLMARKIRKYFETL